MLQQGTTLFFSVPMPSLFSCPPPFPPQVVFFMHGILDTSLTWVSSGVTGSQAFAAWDRGLDVWLGSSRNNPPRACMGE
jgi:hypothetical protein